MTTTMKRISPFLPVVAALAIATPAAAAPRHSKAVRHAKPPRAAKVVKAAPKGDPQALVSAGKMPAFYTPTDLSKKPVISAPAAILVDADTGQVLYEKNADLKREPASTTKIMTALLFIEKSRPNDVVTCLDPSICKIEESSLHIKPWEKFTAQDLLYGFMLRSGNDAAVLIAQHVAGSVPRFAALMNARAAQIGAKNTNFVNPNGLHSPGHVTTARDLALIASEALKNPRFADAVGTPSRVIERSVNKGDSVITMRVKKYFFDRFPGADGVKTGYTRRAGHCFVGSATRDGRRLLSVVLGAKNSASNDTIPLLSWGFARFPAVHVARTDQTVGPVPITGGVKDAVAAVPSKDLHATADRLAPGGVAAVTTDIRPANVSAPIRKGQVVGTIAAVVAGKQVGEAELLAAEDVPAAPVAAALTRVSRGPGVWAVPAMGTALLGLIAWRYAAAVTEGARRRRSRLAAAGRGADRGGARPR